MNVNNTLFFTLAHHGGGAGWTLGSLQHHLGVQSGL